MQTWPDAASPGSMWYCPGIKSTLVKGNRQGDPNGGDGWGLELWTAGPVLDEECFGLSPVKSALKASVMLVGIFFITDGFTVCVGVMDPQCWIGGDSLALQ